MSTKQADPAEKRVRAERAVDAVVAAAHALPREPRS